MTNCPKCSGIRISGPSYRKSVLGYECLTYRCDRCGYSEDKTTHDHKGYVPYDLRPKEN